MPGLAPDSSSISYQWTYDVFINFRGEDTRYDFTGNLNNALTKAGVSTFFDDQEVRPGDEITPTLRNAIEKSRMAITVFSKNYASSTFCLDELVHIYEHIKREGRLVWPIFYDVEPSEVRHQKGNYGQALSLHMKNLRADEQKIQSWRLALREMANISGLYFIPGHNGYECQFIERIVREISGKIKRVLLHVATYPVGLESRVLAINSLLQIGSTDKVIMVGICGIGGLGKTTIARAVHNSIADNFEGICFYHDIKEDSRNLGLKEIQKTIISEILGVDIKIQDVYKGVEAIKMRLKQKKILLILDNIDKQEQLEKLAGDRNWFSGGSRIIITTRDRHLLERHRVESIFDMEAFNPQESLELLSWNAFRNHQANPSYVEVLDRAVIYAQGLPLALEVIGSNLCGRSIDEWESMLDAYKLIPNKDIQQVLKMSYEGLEEVEKEIFLDIACFFKWKCLEDVRYMEEVVHGFKNLSYFIRVLVDKCLIKIGNYNYIEMHDLIRDMGREIVRAESPNNPGKRSRLWFHQDIVDVLEGNTGTDRIKMIVQDYWSECIEVNWDGEAFRNMKELKVIGFENVKFSESPRYLPNSLKVLKWRRYPSSCFPPSFCPKKLIVLDIGDSYLSSLEVIKTSNNLGILNLEGCEYVREIPDLSNLRNLKELSLWDCKNLIGIHDSIGYLPKLEILLVSGCVRLKTFPCAIKLPSLRTLSLYDCRSLKYFPEILEKVKISELRLVGTGIEKLPWSICNLSELRKLEIEKNESVIEIPNSIFLLTEIRRIIVARGGGKVISCNSKEAKEEAIWFNQCFDRVGFDFPCCSISDDILGTELSRYKDVQYLDLRGNDFTTLPAWMKECHFLDTLLLDDCKHLREIEGIPPRIEVLCARNCVSLSLESKNLLLSEELHRDPGRYHYDSDEMERYLFCVPSGSIPKWFDHRSKGASISFWFRNSFPHHHYCFLLKPAYLESGINSFRVRVEINGELKRSRPLFGSLFNPLYFVEEHLVVQCLLDFINDEFKRRQLSLENRWHHVEVSVRLVEDLVIEESGMYVINQLCEMEDVTFTNPYHQTLDSTWGNQAEQMDTRMKEEEVPINKKRRLTGDDNFASSSTVFICPINQDDNQATPHIPFVKPCEIINNYQGNSIEDDEWPSLHPCWETPFNDESSNHQELQQQNDVTSTNVEVSKSFEDTRKAKGKEIVIYDDTINE